MNDKKLKVGDKIWSKFFNDYLIIVEIQDNNNWWFRREKTSGILKAQTPLSYFEEDRG